MREKTNTQLGGSKNPQGGCVDTLRPPGARAEVDPACDVPLPLQILYLISWQDSTIPIGATQSIHRKGSVAIYSQCLRVDCGPGAVYYVYTKYRLSGTRVNADPAEHDLLRVSIFSMAALLSIRFNPLCPQGPLLPCRCLPIFSLFKLAQPILPGPL